MKAGIQHVCTSLPPTGCGTWLCVHTAVESTTCLGSTTTSGIYILNRRATVSHFVDCCTNERELDDAFSLSTGLWASACTRPYCVTKHQVCHRIVSGNQKTLTRRLLDRFCVRSGDMGACFSAVEVRCARGPRACRLKVPCTSCSPVSGPWPPGFQNCW